jgi:hypothetical protein
LVQCHSLTILKHFLFRFLFTYHIIKCLQH